MPNPSYEYNPNQDYCDQATRFQPVLNYSETKQKLLDNGKACEPQDIYDDRAGTLYSCNDSYQMGNIQDNYIYISTTDDQHDQVIKGERVTANGGFSGYFSDQATIDSCKKENALDNTKYNETCQIAPYRKDSINGIGDATYKPHVDCLEIDRDTLFKNYGTYDFNAAIAKCEANNHFGSGGGNQGYNPYISEMIENKSLIHNPYKSYSDKSISNSPNCNPNTLTNSVVDELDYRDMIRDAQTRAQDCVNNNAPHPSSEACDNGFSKNEFPIQTNTGNATLITSESNSRDINLQADLGIGTTPIETTAGQAVTGGIQ